MGTVMPPSAATTTSTLPLPVLMVRPHNLVAMEWSELDLDNQVWTIAARKIKNRQHIKKADRQQIKINIFLSPTSINSYITTLGIKGLAKKGLEEASEYILQADRNRAVRKYPVVIYFKLEEKIYFTYANPKLDACLIGNDKLYELLDDFVVDSTENNPLANIFS